MRQQLPEGAGFQPVVRESSWEYLKIILEKAIRICHGKKINPDWHLWRDEQAPVQEHLSGSKMQSDR